MGSDLFENIFISISVLIAGYYTIRHIIRTLTTGYEGHICSNCPIKKHR